MYSKDLYIQKMENKEIDVLDLSIYIMKKWKKILGISIILSIFLSFIIYYKFGQNDNGQAETQVVMEQLTEEQQTRVRNGLKLYDQLDNMEDYKNNSSFMQLDAYNSCVTTIQYFVSAPNKRSANTAYELYLNYVEQGDFKEKLQKELGNQLDKPADLVVLQNEFYDASEGNDLDKTVLTLKINAPDEKLNEQIRTIVKKSINEYRENVVDQFVEKHELKIISESTFRELDDSVREKQESIEKSIGEKKQQIMTIETQMTEEEKTVLNQERDFSESGKTEAIKNSGRDFSYKWLLAVWLLSIFLACGIFTVCYLLNNKVKSSKEILKYFDISCIEIKKEKNKEFVAKELGLFCRTHMLESVFISCLDINDKERVQEMLPLIPDTTLILGGNVYDDADDMEKAKSCGNLIFVVKVNTTSYNSIFATLQKCEELGINVAGAIVDEI